MASFHKSERALTLRYSLVAGLGFCTDAALLKAGMALGLGPAAARCVSLFCAMQVTFFVNGHFVFKCLERRRVCLQWASYMATNGFGNLCNYFIFVTMISTHWPIVSDRWTALATASLTAWMINYASTRFIVFRKKRRGGAQADAASADPGAGGLAEAARP